MLWVLDLDGVVWLGGEVIPGATEAVERLRNRGHRLVFLTNNSGPTLADHVAKLLAMGIDASFEELATSAQAAASMLPSGSSALVVGGAGLREALAAGGVVEGGFDNPPDAVVVGRSTELDYRALAHAADAIREGARFVAANTDATYPTPNGLLPGAGALVAFLATASGVAPEVAGKPHEPTVQMVRRRFGQPDVMVGDRVDTDGAFAATIGAQFALVLSGVTTQAGLPVTPTPTIVAADLASAVDQLG